MAHRMSISALVLLSASLLLAPLSAPQSLQFDKAHAFGLKENPSGVTFGIVTIGGSSIYRSYEVIRLKMEFAGSRQSPYTVQAAEKGGDEVVFQRIGASNLSRLSWPYGFVCCSSNLRPLSETPIGVPTYVRFGLPPGDYMLFMQTMRVSGPKDKGDTDFRTTSNALRIIVLPNK